jgi:hypothetical protein
MVDESKHSKDDESQQASPDTRTGEGAAAEDDLFSLMSASPERPKSDLGLKTKVGRPSPPDAAPSAQAYRDEVTKVWEPFALDPETGAAFYSFSQFGGPQFGPGSCNPAPLPSHVAKGEPAGSSTRYLFGSGEVTFYFVLALTGDDDWELWRSVSSEAGPVEDDQANPEVSDFLELVAFTQGPVVDRAIAERVLLIGHIREWEDDYATDDNQPAELSLTEPQSHYYAWGLFVWEEDISWFDAPSPGPDLVRYLQVWKHEADPMLLKLIMGDDSAASWSSLVEAVAHDDSVSKLMDTICRVCGVERSLENPIQALS